MKQNWFIFLFSLSTLLFAQGEKEQRVSIFNSHNLDGWLVSQFGTQGEAYVKNEQIILTRSDGCTGVTWDGEFPTTNYQVTLEAKRLSGNDFFCSMTFPINKDYCTLIVGGWGNMIVGLSNVDGEDALRNETNELGVFKNNQWYKVRLRVVGTKIEAWIDGEKYVNFETSGHSISIRSTMEVATPFGISAFDSIAAIKNVTLEYLP